MYKKISIAVAGSGKTTRLVEESLKIVREDEQKKVLIVSYTHNGINAINEILLRLNKNVLHDRIIIKSWYSFLFSECIRPYQKVFDEKLQVKRLFFQEYGEVSYLPKSKTERYIVNSTVLSNHASEFVIECGLKNDNSFVKRLNEIYSHIFIDEVQDLNGYDLEVLKAILEGISNVWYMGDHRQATFVTHQSTKNKSYKKSNIKLKFEEWAKIRIAEIDYINECNRSVQSICDFADLLYPEEIKTKSLFGPVLDLNGVYIIKKDDINKIHELFSPLSLRISKATKVPEQHQVLNFGESKGLTCEYSLIYTPGPLKNFIEKTTELVDPTKYYIALTRARKINFLVYDKLTTKNKNFTPYKIETDTTIIETLKYNML